MALLIWAGIFEMGEGVAFTVAGVATIWLMGSPEAWTELPSEFADAVDPKDSLDASTVTLLRSADTPLVQGGAGIGGRSCAPLWATGLEAFDGIALINAAATAAVSLDGTFKMSVVEVLAELTTTGDAAMVEGPLGSSTREAVSVVVLAEQTVPLSVGKVFGAVGMEGLVGRLEMAVGSGFLEIDVAFDGIVALLPFVVPR